ncbi:MAG TPA: thioredoxin domain-containing protein [Pyrinomonadaceae bacterium]|nr:thioredoxin domain-containing protein [Pyrinomonadaceae bacterium]
MNQNRVIITILISLAVLSLAAAQTPRRRAPAKPPTTKPAPADNSAAKTTASNPQPSPAQPAEVTATTLAVVNDITISASDIEDQVSAIINRDPDPYLRAYYADPQKETIESRQRAFDARVNSLLIAAEAKKRGKTSDQVIETEINSKVPTPTEAEIQAAYDANRNQIGTATLESVRAELINYIRNERSQELYAALIRRLKMTNAVNKNADVNAPNLAPGTVLAAVNGEPLRVDTINERTKAYIYKLEMRTYAVRKDVLDRRINDLLIVAEANKRKVGPEDVVRTEITDKITQPTEAQTTRFYEENKANIKRDLAEARTAIATYLQQQQQEKLETALAEKLRAGAKVQILLKEPDPSLLNVGVAGGATRGDVNAAVTIIEFTDFQCSACGGMYPIVEDVLKSYGNRVRFVIRNFPLTQVHANAFHAAQAAEAAKAQGKFWEYIDFLFKNQTALDTDSLKKYATQVGLDRKRFDADLEAGKYDAVIRRDIEDGEVYGVEATPTFFINGAVLTEYSADGLRAAIEKAFARAGKRTP